ncbi:hypothetical protein T12_7489 [Trichinella patagoniensis]|uniref:Uncharacterized protein n=1 Tax=Trichinella patagoniensis TaxID=990121 RepID=A0A0V0ZR95_9BILA|nr:hypothetical protein T12_7489 [Trichinella patagoniensis]
MRIICTTHNVSEAKITNQLIDTCATYSSVDALLYGQPDGCYLAPGVVRRLTAVCKEPTHFPSGELFEEEINDRQVTHFVYAAACQLGASYRTPANRTKVNLSSFSLKHHNSPVPEQHTAANEQQPPL